MNISRKDKETNDWNIILSENNGFSITVSTPQYFITFENSEELEIFLLTIGKGLFNYGEQFLKESKK